MSTSEQGAVAEDDSPIDEARLEAILKDPQLKTALLKKMGLRDKVNKDQHITPSGMSTGGWPPYPLAPLGWPGFIPPFPYGPAAPRARLMPTWGEGRGPENQWAGLGYKPDDAEETDSSHAEEPGPSSKRPRLEEEEDSITLLDESEALELVEFDPKVKPSDTWEPP